MESVNDLYPLVALFLYECESAVTKEGMKAIFDHVGAEFHPKLAELFCVDKEKMKGVYTSLTQAPAVAGGADVAGSADKKTEDKPKEEEEPAEAAEDVDLFGDDGLFG